MNSRFRLPLFILTLAVLVAAFAFSAPAQAQDDSYVDLSVEILSGTSWRFIVRNHGTADAYGVTVDIEIADQTIDSISPGFEQKSGTTCSGNIPGTTCINGGWTVGTLGAGEEREVGIGPRLKSGLPCCTGSDRWTVPAWAVIKNTVPEEEERFKHDNTDTGWILVNRGRTGTLAAFTDYWLEASVDDILPDPGDTVKFTFKVVRTGGAEGSIDGAKVRLKLDNGMGTPTATPTTETFSAVTGSTRTWDWDFAITHPAASKTLEVSTTLANPLPSGVARSDLCLIAELTVERPDDRTPGDTTAEICLREDPVVLLQEGDAILFNMYPCVSVTAYPCTSSDTLEVLVTDQGAAKAAGIGRYDAVLDPEKVIIQVKDPEARLIDTQSASVNSGTEPSWETAREPDHRSGDRTVGGVGISYTRRQFDSTQIDNYSNLARTMAVTALDGGAAPGLVKVRYPGSGNVFYDLTTTGSHERPTFGLTSASTSIFAYFAEFTTLGTYKMDFTAAVTHTDTNVYSDTGSYIFHVGPVAELEARDNGPNPELVSTQRAFTIVAVNNGPDDAPAAQVTMTGLNTSDYVSHSATSGTFNSTTGIWTIGELRETGYFQDIYGRDGEVLTIITTAAVDAEITAEIENTQPYQVCIDSNGDDVAAGNQADCKTESGNTNAWHAAVCVNTADNEIDSTITVEATCDSTTDRAWTENVCASSAGGVLAAHTEAICFGWHTTPYYDYISDNSTSVTIKAKGGTGAELPSLGSPGAGIAAIKVTWDPVTEVNGRAVTHYEVQRETNPWVTVADDVARTEYVDTDVDVGDTFRYRVRAVNDRGQEGPWSQPMEGSVAEAETPEPEVRVETEIEYRDRVVVRTEEGGRSSSSDDDDDDYAHFATLETTRSVPENSAAGSAVGNPVVASANRGNRVTYSLEGDDADHFDVEPDSGQILVGEDAVLDHEGGPDSYTVVVVADPRRGGTDRVTVTINVIDVPETASLILTPEGTPAQGQELTAAIDHPGGEVTVVDWQWQRSADGMTWQTIPGADTGSYTPTASDAGLRLRVIALYRPPGDDESLALAGLVTPSLPGEATNPATPSPDPQAGQGSDAGSSGATEAQASTALGVALLPGGDPAGGDPVIAYLVGDPDSVTWSSWQWQRSLDGVAWQDIPGADRDHYEPALADAGHFLRVIYSYLPAGSLEALLTGAVTDRMPGTPVAEAAPEPTPAPSQGPSIASAPQASAPQAEPTPVPVAAATPAPTPLPTAVPTPVTAPEPTLAPTAAPEPTAATPAPLLVTASTLASRGVGAGSGTGGNAPANGSTGVESATSEQTLESAAAPQGQGTAPLEQAAPANPATPPSGREPATVEAGGRDMLVWVALAAFAALVVSGGGGYYYLRMRRR